MTRRIAIAALFASLGFVAVAGGAQARDCGMRCGGPAATQLAELRGPGDAGSGRFERAPEYRGYGRDRVNGGRVNGDRFGERRGITAPTVRDQPLSDSRIWAIAKQRVPGRIVSARLHGHAYSFRIVSNRGSVVDVVVDRYSGRILSVRGGS